MEIKQAIKFKELVNEYEKLSEVLENVERGYTTCLSIHVGAVSINLATLNEQVIDLISERARQLESIIGSVKPVQELENF